MLNDMENLLEMARIPLENQVNIVKIQLTNVARTLWKSEKARLERPIA